MDRLEPNITLEEDQYLLKIRDVRWDSEENPTGFLTKLNKDGSIPLKFWDWVEGQNEDFTIVTNTFLSGWRIVSVRYGVSRNWGVVLHPDGYELEIHLSERWSDNDGTLLGLIKTESIVKGEIKGEYKWSGSRLIKK